MTLVTGADDQGQRGSVLPHAQPRQAVPRGVEQQGVAVLKAARYAGAQVIWALAGLVACGGLVYVLITKGPPEISVAGADAWTSNDQIRFEQTNNERIAKLERILERMDALLITQARTTDKMLSLMEKVDERVRALEQWREGERRK